MWALLTALSTFEAEARLEAFRPPPLHALPLSKSEELRCSVPHTFACPNSLCNTSSSHLLRWDVSLLPARLAPPTQPSSQPQSSILLLAVSPAHQLWGSQPSWLAAAQAPAACSLALRARPEPTFSSFRLRPQQPPLASPDSAGFPRSNGGRRQPQSAAARLPSRVGADAPEAGRIPQS